MVIAIHESQYPALYPLFVLLGFASLLLFPSATRGLDRTTRRRYYVVQCCTLIGAVLGAKIAVLMGDRHWPVAPITSFREWIDAGRSITGALLGGLLAAEIAKPLAGYTLPPNDLFAMRIPFSLAVGRLGCLFGGCCRGLPHAGGWLSLRYEDGIERYPSALYELAFQLCTGLLLVHLVRRGVLRGRIYSLYLVLYGVFRFATEFVRDTPRYLAPFSTYQAIAVVMAIVGASALAWRTVRAAEDVALEPKAVRS